MLRIYLEYNILSDSIIDSIICRINCIAFIEYILAGKKLVDYSNLSCLNDYKKNDKIIYKYFKDQYVKSQV